MRIGVISDTHGQLGAEALEQLRGVDRIIHAGDIGGGEIIPRLEAIAPVSAVTGNVDWGGALDRRYPRTLSLKLNGCLIYVTHIGGKPAEFSRMLPTPKPQVAICGHSHKALLDRYQDVLYLNPGTASSPRFGGGLSVAILTCEEGMPRAEIIHLGPKP